MKHYACLLFSILLFMVGCRPDEPASVSPLWELRTVYPVFFLQDIDSFTIGASAFNRYLLINKNSGKVTEEIPIIGTSVSGIIWEDHDLYYGTSDRVFRCYDVRQRTLHWESETSLQIEALPAVDRSMVYGGSRDHYFYALDRYSGNLRWKFKTAGPIYARPVLYDSLVLIGSWDTRLYALHRETGREIWQFSAGAGIDQLPVIANRILWLPNYDYHIYGIDLASGKLLFTFAAENAFEFGGTNWNNTLIFSGIDRKFYFVDTVKRTVSIPGKSPVAISTRPLVHKDALYTGQYDGCLYRWDLPAMTKTLLHRFEGRVLFMLSDGHYLWAASWDRSVACFSLDNNQ